MEIRAVRSDVYIIGWGDGPDADMFMVDEFTGDIRLMKPLDRDSPQSDEQMLLNVI